MMNGSNTYLIAAVACLGLAGDAGAANWDTKTADDWEEAAADEDWQMTPGLPYFPYYKVEKISEHVYTFREGFYRSPFFITGEGVIATDPLTVAGGKRMLREIKLLTDEPIKYVIYSHSHWDHVAGGQPFKDEGAQFISQERCLTNFKLRANPDVVMPDVTFDENYTLELGEVSIEMQYFGPSHDICLTVGVIKPENILWAVDVAPPAGGNNWPFNPTMADVYMYNMVPFLRSIEALVKEEGIKMLMGGHAHFNRIDPPMKGMMPGIVMDGTMGPPDSVTRRRIFWERANEVVANEIEAGLPLDEIPAKLSEQGALSELVTDYDEALAKILFTRIVELFRTGQ